MDYSSKLDREACSKDPRLVAALEPGGIHLIRSEFRKHFDVLLGMEI